MDLTLLEFSSMYCPKCCDVLEETGRTLHCVRGEMEMSQHLAENLRACYSAEAQPATVSWREFECAVKGAGQQWVEVPPGNWIAPPGNNRSSGGSNEAAEASGAEGLKETW